CAFTPLTTSHNISNASAAIPSTAMYANRRSASGGYRNVSQPKPASTIKAPRKRGRKIDRKIRQPISRQYTRKRQGQRSRFDHSNSETAAPSPATAQP